MFLAIVISLTAVVALFVFIWVVNPGFRQWIERPKYRMLDQERRFDRSMTDKTPPEV